MEKRRYFIAYVLSGPAAEYHRTLVQNIGEHFGLPTGPRYFPSHWTIKAPFEATFEEISEVRAILSSLPRTFRAAPFTIQGFGHFGRRIITLDILPSSPMEHAVKKIQESLKTLPWMEWGAHEPIFHFHVTLAKKFPTERFDVIWEYVQKYGTPRFNCIFNEITILRYHNNEWVLDRAYPFDF